jgi:hypothetical protein
MLAPPLRDVAAINAIPPVRVLPPSKDGGFFCVQLCWTLVFRATLTPPSAAVQKHHRIFFIRACVTVKRRLFAMACAAISESLRAAIAPALGNLLPELLPTQELVSVSDSHLSFLSCQNYSFASDTELLFSAISPLQNSSRGTNQFSAANSRTK